MESTSKQILSIRARNGNDCQVCPTCDKPADRPFRRYVGDTLTYGCIDACHTASLTGVVSESSRWHFRREAIDARQDELTRLLNEV